MTLKTVPETKLAAFEARMYDAITGRWLAVDPQHQFHSPYLAMGNNPVMMVDPDGELAWFVAPLIFAAVNVAVDMALSNGNMTTEQILLSAAMGALAGATSGATTVGGAFLSAGVGQLNRFMPGITIPLGEGVSISANIGVGYGTSGFAAGFNAVANVTSGDRSLSFGIGAGSVGDGGGYFGHGITARDGDFGFGFNRTQYYGAQSQMVGGLSLSYKKVSFRLENDYFGDRHDRWRSSAFELGVGDFVFGSNIVNNDVGPNAEFYPDGRNLLGKKNKPKKDGTILGAWKEGQTYSAPAWIGYKKNGQVQRFGYSHKIVQDRTQNFTHRNFGPVKTHYYNRYDEFKTGFFNYIGYNNPYSLW